MKSKIAVIHTSLAIRQRVDDQIQKAIPEAEIHNIIDEQMLQDVVAQGGIYPSVVRRMHLYIQAAEAMGADVILNACSSVGGAFDLARTTTELPTVRIDEPMAEEAVARGHDIIVYGTVATTLKPSAALIEKVAAQQGKDVKVTQCLVEGAFDVLSKQKDPERHNQMVLERIEATHQGHDVVVLAQASMAILIPLLGQLDKPVLYSLESGVERVRQVLA